MLEKYHKSYSTCIINILIAIVFTILYIYIVCQPPSIVKKTTAKLSQYRLGCEYFFHNLLC